MRENTDQKNSEYGHFSHSVSQNVLKYLAEMYLEPLKTSKMDSFPAIANSF